VPMQVVVAIRDYLRAAGRLESMQAETFIFVPVRNILSPALLGKAEDWREGRAVSWDTMGVHLKHYAAWAGLDEKQINFHTLQTTAFMFRLEGGDTAAELGEFFDYKADTYVQKLIYRLKRGDKQPLWKEDPKQNNNIQQQHRTTIPIEANPTNPQNQEDHPMQDHTNDEYFSSTVSPTAAATPYPRPPYIAQLPSPALQHGLYARALPESEMALAAQNRQEGLDGEIDALRVVMMRTLLRANDAEDPKDQMRLLEVFSTAAQRLSTLLKAHRELDGGQSELERLIQSISQDILSEHGWPDPQE
jgi:hypothetical protein